MNGHRMRRDPMQGAIDAYEAIARSLAHNMSTPPKSVVAFEGLGALAKKGVPGGSGLTSVGYQDSKFFGTAVRVAMHPKWWRLRTAGFLRLIEPESKRRSPKVAEARLHAHIERRATELPLPTGCLTIASKPQHPVLWHDALTVLAVLTKCADTVWLRDKLPSLAAALDLREVSLLVPPDFVDRLPAVPTPPLDQPTEEIQL